MPQLFYCAIHSLGSCKATPFYGNLNTSVKTLFTQQ